MRGIFCYTERCSSEEFQKIMRKRGFWYLGICIMGLLTLVMVFVTDGMEGAQMAEYTRGFLSGMGSGLIAGGAVLFLRSRRILKHEELLKKERIRCTDERERAISSKALKCCAVATIVSVYVMIIYGAVFSPELVRPMLLILCVFVLTYVAASRFYQGRL